MESKQLGTRKAASLGSLSKEQLTSFMENIDAVMFDCDGELK